MKFAIPQEKQKTHWEDSLHNIIKKIRIEIVISQKQQQNKEDI